MPRAGRRPGRWRPPGRGWCRRRWSSAWCGRRRRAGRGCRGDQVRLVRVRKLSHWALPPVGARPISGWPSRTSANSFSSRARPSASFARSRPRPGPGLGGALDDAGAVLRAEPVAVAPDPAVRGLHEGEGEGVEDLGGAEPDVACCGRPRLGAEVVGVPLRSTLWTPSPATTRSASGSGPRRRSRARTPARTPRERARSARMSSSRWRPMPKPSSPCCVGSPGRRRGRRPSFQRTESSSIARADSGSPPCSLSSSPRQ